MHSGWPSPRSAHLHLSRIFPLCCAARGQQRGALVDDLRRLRSPAVKAAPPAAGERDGAPPRKGGPGEDARQRGAARGARRGRARQGRAARPRADTVGAPAGSNPTSRGRSASRPCRRSRPAACVAPRPADRRVSPLPCGQPYTQRRAPGLAGGRHRVESREGRAATELHKHQVASPAELRASSAPPREGAREGADPAAAAAGGSSGGRGRMEEGGGGVAWTELGRRE